MRRPRLLAALAVTAVGLLACRAARPPATPPASAEASPNILLVVLDTLRYDSTGLARRGGQTPAIEGLAARAVEFRRAYSTHDATMPSHFSLLTGFVGGRRSPLDREEHGLPHQLRRLGYATIGLSANGNLTPRAMPVVRGFQEYVCLYDRWVAMPEEQKADLLPGIDERISFWGGRTNDYNRGLVFTSAKNLLPKLKRFLAREKEQQRPFFAFVNLMESHDPYFPDPSLASSARCRDAIPQGFDADIRFRQLPEELLHPETVKDPARRADITERIARARRRWTLADGLTPAQLDAYRCRYDAEVREADVALGSVLHLLEERGLLESTIVVVTSDHGESFGEAGFVTHSLGDAGDVEATQHVPLVLSLPGRFGLRPAKVDELVTIADVVPTLYDLLGVDWRPLVGVGAVGNLGRSLVTQLEIQRPATIRQLLLPQGALRKVSTSDVHPPGEDLERLRALGYVE